MEFFLFFLRKFSQLHVLLEPPRLLISEKPAQICTIKKSHLHALLESPRLFDFGKFTSIEKTVTQTYIVFFNED